jgi:YD repeat-containing protein
MKNKIAALTTLSLITLLSFGKNVFNANAIDIADPSGWDYKYDYDSTSSRLEFTTPDSSTEGKRVPFLQPTTNVFVSDYRYGFNLGGLSSYDDEAATPFGFYIMSQTTTTSFSQVGSVWYPTSNVIGSDSGSLIQKIFLEFTNPTNVNYQIGINISDSSSSTWSFRYLPSINANIGANPMSSTQVSPSFTRSSSSIMYFYLPPYSNLYINSPVSVADMFFRSFWVAEGSTIFTQSFGDGYEIGLQEGYDDGFIDGQDSAESNVTSRISNLLSQTFAGVRNVFNIKIFDQLTIGSVMLFPLAFGIFTFIFRLIRGGKA